MTTTEKDGQLELADGTPVRKGPDGKLVYADDGTPVKIEEETERVVDQRRSGVTISYSPEFADLETNTTLLKNLAHITGGQVYKEDSKSLKDLAMSGELYRPAPEGVRALLPLWYWLVFIVGVGLLLDVGVRRISLEPAEVGRRRTGSGRGRGGSGAKRRTKTTPSWPGCGRRKRWSGRAWTRAGRPKFDPTGPSSEPPPPGADDGPSRPARRCSRRSPRRPVADREEAGGAWRRLLRQAAEAKERAPWIGNKKGSPEQRTQGKKGKTRKTENRPNMFHTTEAKRRDELSKIIIGAAIEVHRELGPGLLESTYESCLEHELQERGLHVERQLGVPLKYKRLNIDNAYRIDLLVEGTVIIELKAVQEVEGIHEAQTLTYLRLSRRWLGLLLNFNVRYMKNGLKRLVWDPDMGGPTDTD